MNIYIGILATIYCVALVVGGIFCLTLSFPFPWIGAVILFFAAVSASVPLGIFGVLR